MPLGIVYFHFILVTLISVSNPLAPSLAGVSLDDLLEEVEDLTEEEALTEDEALTVEEALENSAVLNELSGLFISLLMPHTIWYCIILLYNLILISASNPSVGV